MLLDQNLTTISLAVLNPVEHSHSRSSNDEEELRSLLFDGLVRLLETTA